MNEGRARTLLGAIAQAAEALRDVLACEAPEFERFWSGVVAECRELAATPVPPVSDGLEDLAERILGAFGVGMGSLSDLVLWRDEADERRRVNAHLRGLRCELGDLAAQLRDEARAGVIIEGRVRFYLTALESLLLRGNEADAAAACRALLDADELACSAVFALVASMAQRAWRHPWTGTQAGYILAALRSELQVYIDGAEAAS